MRTKRWLLAASALSTLTFCSKAKDPETQPLPGNPKGTMYDAAMVAPEPDAEIRYAANPKGTVYDESGAVPTALDAGAPPRDGPRPPRDAPSTPSDAAAPDAAAPRDAVTPDAAPPRDAAAPPRDATIRRPSPDGPPLKGNPKGSRYDKGQDDPGL